MPTSSVATGADPAPIVVVAENRECVAMLKTLLVAAGIVGQVIDFATGGEAAAFLTSCASDLPIPQLVFLDLQLPKSAALLFLWWLRSERLFDRVPVLALGCSKQEQDIALERRRGADFYLYKYPTVSGLRRVCASALAKRGVVEAGAAAG